MLLVMSLELMAAKIGVLADAENDARMSSLRSQLQKVIDNTLDKKGSCCVDLMYLFIVL